MERLNKARTLATQICITDDGIKHFIPKAGIVEQFGKSLFQSFEKPILLFFLTGWSRFVFWQVVQKMG